MEITPNYDELFGHHYNIADDKANSKSLCLIMF